MVSYQPSSIFDVLPQLIQALPPNALDSPDDHLLGEPLGAPLDLGPALQRKGLGWVGQGLHLFTTLYATHRPALYGLLWPAGIFKLVARVGCQWLVTDRLCPHCHDPTLCRVHL